MPEFEKKFLKLLEQNITVLFFVGIMVAAVYMRIGGLEYASSDYLGCLEPWYEDIKANGGFAALQHLTGNYNVPYQVLLAIMTYIPMDSMLLIKIVSMVFDLLLAIGVGCLTCELMGKKREMLCWQFLLPYGATLVLPTVVMNSAVWAQCDSIYLAFAVWSLYFYVRGKYIPTFVMFGIALAFKLQAIFLLPFFLFAYVREKQFSILHFALLPLMNLLLGIPALLQGLPWSEFWGIYSGQSDEYPYMFLNFQSIWVLIGDNYEHMKEVAIWMMVAVIGAGMFFLIRKRISLQSPLNFTIVVSWMLWAIVILLPGMHERYGAFVEITLLVLLFVSKKPKAILFFSLAEICSCVVYGKFLFGNYVELNICTWIYIIGFLLFTIWAIENLEETKQRTQRESIYPECDLTEVEKKEVEKTENNTMEVAETTKEIEQ